MMDKILVATDGSESSNRAIDFAVELAKVHNAQLHVMNVIRKIQIPPEMENLARVESLGETRLSVLEYVANQILNDAEKRAESQDLTLTKKSIGHEDPATSIAQYAKKHSIDLVVVGTRGLSKVKALLMGSVSRKITEICNVNCLIVR